MNNSNNSPQKALIGLENMWLELSTSHNQKLLPDTINSGIKISTSLVSKNQSEFERILTITINNQQFQIVDHFSNVSKVIGGNKKIHESDGKQSSISKQLNEESNQTQIQQQSGIEVEQETRSEIPYNSDEDYSDETINYQSKKQTLKGESSQKTQVTKRIRKSSHNSAQKNNRRDRKNLVKNFVKSFRGFLNCVVDEKIIMDIKKVESVGDLDKFRMEFENWINSKNYNNSLIIELIKHPEYNQLFEFYLEERAKDWIENSKIYDKESHLEALEEYLEGFKQERGLAKVRVLKYRKLHKNKGAQLKFEEE